MAAAAQPLESVCSAGTPIFTFTGPPDRPKLYSKLEAALQCPKFADVTLVARGGRIRANKLILDSQCTKLSSKLSSGAEEIALNIDVNILKHVLSYIYINKADVPKVDLERVERAAASLGVEELCTECIRALLALEITIDNCLQVWMKASEINDKKIIKSAQDFALKHFVKLQKLESFCTLPYALLIHYISHKDLGIRSDEERLSAAITWVEADTSTRYTRLVPLLEALPLRKMTHWFLEHMVSKDPLIKGIPEAGEKISQAMQAYRPGEKCLVFSGAEIEGKRSREVKAIRLGSPLRVMSLGQLEGKILDTYTNCIMVGNTLYSCGLGQKCDEVWSHDVKERSSKLVTRLNTGRQRHGVALGPAGHLYIIGGENTSGQYMGSIEEINLTTRTCTTAGHLKNKACLRLACCQAQGGDVIIVWGAKDDQMCSYIQVYDTRTSSTTHTLSLPGAGYTPVYGVVQVKGYLIVVTHHYTAVVSGQDVLHGCISSLTLSNRYVTPNSWCAVVLSEDDTRLLLLGGEPRGGKPQHYMYSATVDDILKNTKKGWQKDSTPWTLGEYKFVGGYDIAYIAKDVT